MEFSGREMDVSLLLAQDSTVSFTLFDKSNVFNRLFLADNLVSFEFVARLSDSILL